MQCSVLLLVITHPGLMRHPDFQTLLPLSTEPKHCHGEAAVAAAAADSFFHPVL